MSTSEPHLAPPGAGLPLPELIVGRLLFTVGRWFTSRAGATANFQREREKVRSLVESCDDERAAERVLIARVPGLEDSSRYWSVWMTLEHLRIVHSGFTRVMRALTSGHALPGQANPATVKPSPLVTGEVVQAFEESCDDFLEAVDKAPNLRTRLRYRHPWFGSLTAAGWHALSGSHLRIHRVQIERILGGVPKRGAVVAAHGGGGD